MKNIEVVCAVIEKDGKIFATQRGYGEFKDRWEFPGGKVEQGENPKAALAREIKEELDTEIYVGDLIKTVETDYPSFHITMHAFMCSVIKGELTLLEHESSKWLEMDSRLPYAVDWLPADIEVVLELPKNDELCEIKWVREDIRRILVNAGVDFSEKSIDKFSSSFDWRTFQEKLIQDGNEMLASGIISQI